MKKAIIVFETAGREKDTFLLSDLLDVSSDRVILVSLFLSANITTSN